jgi:multiple sugar transport system ATP-binding protein
MHVAGANGALRASHGAVRIELPADIAHRLQAHAGGEVILGIRPEDLRIAGDGDPAGLCFDAVVEVVEKLGSEILLDVQVEGQSMVAAVPPSVRARRGDRVRLALNPGRLHFFDPGNDAAI